MLVVGEPLVQLVDVLLREPDVVLDVPQLKFCLIPIIIPAMKLTESSELNSNQLLTLIC